MILSVPWLILPVVAYNAIALTGTPFDATVAEVPVISGMVWRLRLGDLVLVGTLALLFVEILKATRPGGNTLVDHALGSIVLMVCLIEFMVVPHAATSLFFFITLAALIGLVVGIVVTLRVARQEAATEPDSM